MARKIVAKQNNSKMCLVSGVENEFGIKASFYELDTGEVYGEFIPGEEHQSYPDRAHGGAGAAFLDEAMARTIYVKEPESWGVTVTMTLTYRQALPLGEKARAYARITSNTRRFFETEGEVLLPDGKIAIQGKARYYKVPLDSMGDSAFFDSEWFSVPEDLEKREPV